jgi:hypothetical protein
MKKEILFCTKKIKPVTFNFLMWRQNALYIVFFVSPSSFADGYRSGDLALWITDPDSALFFGDLRDANKR